MGVLESLWCLGSPSANANAAHSMPARSRNTYRQI
jgi:hypothetical protein